MFAELPCVLCHLYFFSLVNQPVCTAPQYKHICMSHQWPKIRCGRHYIFFHFIQSAHVHCHLYFFSLVNQPVSTIPQHKHTCAKPSVTENKMWKRLYFLSFYPEWACAVKSSYSSDNHVCDFQEMAKTFHLTVSIRILCGDETVTIF